MISSLRANWKGVLFWGLATAVLFHVVTNDFTTRRAWTISAGIFVAAFVCYWLLQWLWERGTLRQARGKAVLLVLYLALMQALYLVFDSQGLDDWTLLIYIAGATVFVLWLTEFWRRWLFLRTHNDHIVSSIAVNTVGALLMLIMTFSVLTGVLVAKGIVETRPPHMDNLFLRTEAYYLWHLWNVLPGLDTPETLRTYETTNAWGGALLFIYNVLVILPVAAALTRIVRRGR